MIKTIRLKTTHKNYTVSIGYKLFKKFIKSISDKQIKKYVIVDQKVYNNIKNEFSKNNFFIIKVKGNEKIKSIEYYWKIISILLIKKIDRSSIIICIGGGALGDLSGFIASTILRGIKFILVPTTLLSQVDSSIGGKNGINSKFGKNHVGTFYQPDKVIIDPFFLKSLSFKQIKSGYAEIVKHAIINDKKFYDWLKNNYKKIYSLKNETVITAIQKSIKIKAKFVIKDEKENLKNSSSRAMLNFGHTFGHAIESINHYRPNLSHGEAISIGMILAAKISYKEKNILKSELDDLINHFKDAKLPTDSKLIKNLSFYKKIIDDKKNMNNKVNLILLKTIGRSYFARNFKINKIKDIIHNSKKL